MQLGDFRCPTQTVTKSIMRGYVAVINDALIALIALANSASPGRLGASCSVYWRNINVNNDHPGAKVAL
jgi:hypothetical protein